MRHSIARNIFRIPEYVWSGPRTPETYRERGIMKPADVRRGVRYENALGQEVVVETVIGDKARVRISTDGHRPVKLVKPVEEIAAEFNRSRRLPPGTTQVGEGITRRVTDDGAAMFEIHERKAFTEDQTYVALSVYVDRAGVVTFGALRSEVMSAEQFGLFWATVSHVRYLAIDYGMRLLEGQP